MKKVEQSLRVFTASDERELYFDLKDSLFFFAHNQKEQSSCAWFVDAHISAEKLEVFLSQLIQDRLISSQHTVLKLIGHSRLHQLSLQVLNKLNLRIEKYVERPDHFEVMYLSSEHRIRLAQALAQAQIQSHTPTVSQATHSTQSASAVASTPSVSSPVRPLKNSGGPLKVLIVDDSKTIRQILEKLFSSDPGLQVVASLEDPREVAKAIETHKPDVMTLDIHMPHLDGVMVLKQILPKYAIPTVMISSISLEEGPMVLNALEAGAVDYIQKPTFDQIASMRETIIEKVKTAARAQVKIGKKNQLRVQNLNLDHSLVDIIAIGSSTGGTEALKDVLTRLPENIPPILIVQHIPPVFSKAFADRMNDLCAFEVKEAEAGDEVKRNRVLIAPGGIHMKLKKMGSTLKVELEDSEPVNRFKPSVDVMFRSVAQLMPKSTMGIILTGMGSDGAKGLLELKEKGAVTIGQDEESCVVYGMPKAAFEIGAVQHVVSLDKIPEKIFALMSQHKEGRAS